ncbi:MAG TPA: ATP-dependent 6-phosphofructokinase, partial [Firmicutes bacterium]|nr:ATP-dependent 6-phosphofructokinase [Bacillota bacterium]
KEVCHALESGIARGKKHSIVVVAEGVMSATELALKMKEEMGFVANTVVLGYVQRGGSPTANDIILGSKLGSRAIDEIASGASGIMVGEINGTIVSTPLEELLAERKLIDPNLYRLALDLVH